MSQKRRVLALISGGLDSLLAAKMMLEQGLEVEGINFQIGFCGSEGAKQVAAQLGIPLHIVDVVDEFKQVVAEPKHGYGAHLNPCLDCKIFMVARALSWAKQHGFDFVITGEVIGQRPKSQRRDTMPVVANESGAEDLLLRPLSAKLLPPTKPEREGWVDREQLLAISGRSRREQTRLAERFGFKEYPQPAGGCLLTDVNFCQRLQDLWQMKGAKDYTSEEIALLRIGRHLRPRPHFKMVIGRSESENDQLERYRTKFVSMYVPHYGSPLVLIDGDFTADDLQLAARITARFSAAKNRQKVEVEIRHPNGKTELIAVSPLSTEEIDVAWYI